jgi:hypothetical protein
MRKYNKHFLGIDIEYNTNPPYYLYYCRAKKKWFNPNDNECFTNCKSCDTYCLGLLSKEYCKTYKAALRRVKRHKKYLTENINFYVVNKYVSHNIKCKSSLDRVIK